MRFSLRTLVIAALALPPLLALLWWDLAYSRSVPLSAILLAFVLYVIVTGFISGPPPEWR